MITLNYTLLTEQEYVDLLVGFISNIEGERANAYADSDGKATIGYGYTFNRSNNVSLWTHAGIQLTAAEFSQLQQIDSALPNQRTQLGLAFSRSLSHSEAIALLRETYPEYEGPADALNMPFSYERAAFVSLTYNRGVAAVNSKMQDFINSAQVGNRAEAWYQIRYNSFGNAQGLSTTNLLGLPTRRYLESAMFGLYGDSSTLTSEAVDEENKNVYRMFNNHKAAIDNYEKKYGLALDGTIGKSKNRSGQTPLQSAIAQSSALAISQVDSIAQALQPAATYLINTYGQHQSFSELDILVGSDGLNVENGLNLVGSSNTNVLLIAGNGTGYLYGGGGNDVLVAGTGTDSLYGGAGTDTYIINAGDGQDTIIDSDGKGKIFENGTQLTGTQVKATRAGSDTTWTDSVSGTIYKFTPNVSVTTGIGTLTITIGSDTITINNFDLNKAQNDATNGYLGINLSKQLTIAADANGVTPSTQGDQTITVAHGNSATFTVYASSASTTAQTITLAQTGDGAYLLSTGATQTAFSGSTSVTIAAGQDSATFTLIDLSNTNSPDTATLTATVTDASGNTTSSNNLAVTFAQPNANVNTAIAYVTGDVSTNVVGGVTYTNASDTLGPNNLINLGGSQNYVTSYGTNADNNLVNGSGGHDYINLTNENNVVIGNAGKLYVSAGNGNNQIYANAQVDLATALTQAKAGHATGQQGNYIGVNDGNNLIVGSNGNDFVTTGAGNNTIVLGNGANILLGGVANGYGSSTLTSGVSSYLYESHWSAAFVNNNLISNGTVFYSEAFTAPANYQGNVDGYGHPVGIGNDTIYGGRGNSSYLLSNGNNYLDAGGGNDLIQAGVGKNTIFGGVGNDTIFGGGGNNYINLESGSDIVELFGGNNTVIGGSGNDTIFSGDNTQGGSSWASTASTANNYIYGGSGNSNIYGSAGNDTLIGGTGNATISGGVGNEYIVGGDGNVSINGGNGNDTIYAGGDGNDTIFAGNGVNSIYGGGGTDIITGGSGTDFIMAGDGGTTAAPTQLFAGSGSGKLYGGAGVDQLVGGSGSDTLIAGSGTSTLQGGSGTEVMYGTIGNDSIIAGSGNDTIYGGGGTEYLQGGTGQTLIVAGTGNETIYGGSGKNTYQFNAGFGSVELLHASSADTLQFGAGISLANLTVTAAIGYDGTAALEIDTADGSTLVIDDGLNGAISQFSFADGSHLSLAQLMAQANSTPTTIAGTNGNLLFSATSGDSLTGSDGNDAIYGFNGNDTLTAGSGNQALYSIGSNNLVTAGAGNDTLISAGSNDTLVGGTGNTTFLVQTNTDLIQAQSTGSNTNTLNSYASFVLPQNIQNLTLLGFNSLSGTGNNLTNIITANSGNDTLTAGSGLATLIGGAGNDTFVVNNSADVVLTHSASNTVITSASYVAPANVQTLTGTGSANITLTGNNLGDTITANSGNDTLISGAGNDVLYDSAGSASFVFNIGDGQDTIYASQANNTIVFGAGITLGNLHVTQAADGTGVFNIQYDSLGDSIQILNGAAGVIQQYQFSNGTTISGINLIGAVINAGGQAPSTVIAPDGSVTTIIVTAGGGYTQTNADPQGDTVTSLFNAAGLKTSDRWTYSDGSHGTDTINADGSSSGVAYHADGSYSSYTTDVNNNTLTDYYNSNGALTSVVQLASNGNLVTTDPLTGVTVSTIIHPDGSSSMTNNDTHGNITTDNYSSTKTLLSDTWQKSDGSTGTDTFNADGSSSGTTALANGTSASYTNDGMGDRTTQYFNSTGILVSDAWQNNQGKHGTDVFNPDGSKEALYYNSDGSYSDTIIDSAGNAVAKYYSATGSLVNTATGTQGNIQGGGWLFDNADFMKDGVYSTTSVLNGVATITFYNASHVVTGSTTYSIPTLAELQAGLGGGFSGGYGSSALPLTGQYDINLIANFSDGNVAQASVALYGDKYPVLSGGVSATNGSVVPANFPSPSYGNYGNYVSSSYYTQDGKTKLPTYGTIFYTVPETSISYTLVPVGQNGVIDISDSNSGTTTINGVLYFYEKVTTTTSTVESYFGANPFPANYTYVTKYSNAVITDNYHNHQFVSVVTNWNDGSQTEYNVIAKTLNAQYANGDKVIMDASTHFNTNYYDSNGLLIGSTPSNSIQTIFDAANQSISYLSTGHEDDVLTRGNYYVGVTQSGAYPSPSSPAGLVYTRNFQTNDGKGDITNYSYVYNMLYLNWLKADGSSGTGTFNLVTNSGTETTTYADGAYTISINDGKGDYVNDNYNSNGVKVTDTWGHPDGTNSSDTFNADGSSSGAINNTDGSYSNYTNDGHGDITTTNYDNGGNELGYNIAVNNGVGNITTTNYDNNGLELGYNIAVNNGLGSTTITHYAANGNELGYSIVVSDGSGHITTTSYNPAGIKLNDSWTNVDGTHGNDTFNANGSSSGTSYNIDSSYSSYTNDGLGDITTANYNPAGIKLNDSWTNVDGTHGNDTFNVDGSSSGTSYNADGSYSNYSNDGLGDITTTNYDPSNKELGYSMSNDDGLGDIYTTSYSPDGIRLSDSSQNSDGSHGSDTFNADGSSSGTSYNSDSSYHTYTDNGQGTYSEQDYGANGSQTGSVVGTYDTLGNATYITYDSTGVKLSDNWSKADGTYGNDIFNADGSSSGTGYNADRSYHTYNTNGQGLYTELDYAVNGTLTGSIVKTNDGLGNTTTTTYDPDGSYQQTTLKSDGSSTSTNYVAATGEVLGSVAQAGAGYSYSYDNTKLGNGITEGKITYTYSDGSTYAADTVNNPDGSYLQSWSKSDGTAGSSTVNASGKLTGDSSVAADGSQAVDAGSNHLLIGTTANDALTGSSGNNFLIGGLGNDTETTGTGKNIIAYNLGDGLDVVNAAAGSNNTVSLGGHFAYADLAFEKNGNNLVLDMGSSNSLTFANWYAGNNNIVDLQVIAAAMSDYAPGSNNVISSSAVENFDFQALATSFDQALAANPNLTTWALTNALLTDHLNSSDSAALGGDLASSYGSRGSLTGMNVAIAQNELSASQFSSAAQTVSPWATLNTGTAQIR